MSKTETRAQALVHRLSRLGRSGGSAAAGGAGSQSVAGFDHQAYAADNADIAAAYSADDAVALKSHFDRYGKAEGRGVFVGEYCAVETLIVSEAGDVFLTGWADRRLLPQMRLELEIGYVRHDLGDVAFNWYPRADVARKIGDTQRPAGFLALLRLPDAVPNGKLRLFLNGQVMHQEASVSWQSPDAFLKSVLTGLAVLADQPVGATLPAAERLYPAVQALWNTYLDQLEFLLAFEHRPARPVRTSIVIALYRTADMLLPQLRALADHLAGSETEVIVVANDLANAQVTAEMLRAYCQIHDVALQLYLCSGNSGFSAANNFGAERAAGEVLVFMNPDVFPPEDAPAHALAFLDSDPGDALQGALLYYGDGLLMHSGMYVARDIAADTKRSRSAPVLRVEHFGKGLSHWITDEDDVLEPVMAPIRDRKLLVTAALWKIRKSVFEEMGGLSTDYLFAYYEDADFCLRCLADGRPVQVDEGARWIHMEGVGKARPAYMRAFMWLNRALFTRRFADSDLIASDHTDLHQL
jgi:GT2 family glycosyltransferase